MGVSVRTVRAWERGRISFHCVAYVRAMEHMRYRTVLRSPLAAVAAAIVFPLGEKTGE